MNVIDPILRHGVTQPAAVALVDHDRTITYGELAKLVLRTAGHLGALGVRRGDYVGVCLKDDWEHVVTLLAIARLGATVVQIDPRARPAEKARIATVFDFKIVLASVGVEMNANSATMALDSGWHRRVAQADIPSSFPDRLARCNGRANDRRNNGGTEIHRRDAPAVLFAPRQLP